MKTVARFALLTLACLLSCLAAAQGILPFKWINSPMSLPACLAYSPDGKKVVVGGYATDNYTYPIRVVTLATGAVMSIPTSAVNGVKSVSFSPDGKTLAVGGIAPYPAPAVLEIWNMTSGTLTARFATQANAEINSVAFSHDGSMVALGGVNLVNGGLAEVWSVSKGQLLETFHTAATGSVNSVAFAPDGKTLITGGETTSPSSGVVETWDATTGAKKATLKTAATYVASVAASSDGKTLAVGGSIGFRQGLLELWSASTGSLLKKLPT